MLRDFPGCAAKISFSSFDDPDFQTELATFLSGASTEPIKQLSGFVGKAGSKTRDGRETSDPAIVTQVLMTLIERTGSSLNSVILRKHVRDEVSWTHGAGDAPWRRCPFWMVLRVGIQRWLYTTHGDEVGRIHYKILMALFFSLLLQDCTKSLQLEQIHHLNSKLCRRIAKLQGDRESLSPGPQWEFDTMSHFLTYVDRATSGALGTIQRAWDTQKFGIKRQVFPIDPILDPQSLSLQLPNSEKYLREVLKTRIAPERLPRAALLPLDFKPSSAVSKPASQFANTCFDLARMEHVHKTSVASQLKFEPGPEGLETACENVSKNIIQYLEKATAAYDDDSEQLSVMLLTVMELWMAMDLIAVRLFPLLKEFSPAFHSDVFNVLQIPRLEDMKRVQKLRVYLHRRHRECNQNSFTIFEDPKEGCFAERYFNESDEHQKLLGYDQAIRLAADRDQAKAEQTWKQKTVEYEAVRVQEATASHEWFPEHDRKRCTLCYLGRVKNRCKAIAHEYPLPENAAEAKTLVFELNCPAAFAAYRHATWQIICHGKEGKYDPPLTVREFWLAEYPSLGRYMTSNNAEDE